MEIVNKQSFQEVLEYVRMYRLKIELNEIWKTIIVRFAITKTHIVIG